MTSGMEALGKTAAAYTPEFAYVKGQYTLGTEQLAYYAVAMRADEAVKSLTLPRDIVLDPMAPIKMEELFQRDLDDKHAGDIVAYLKRPKQPKFFNALTVVVLPLDPTDGRRLAHQYVDLPDRPPILEQAAFSTDDIGPARISAVRANPGVGKISWDTRLAKAVIVDGQHRLYALKSLLSDTNFPHRLDLAETTVPVLVVVLHAKAGFESDAANSASVLTVCRSLFIDLNKHAAPVKDARTYLLDDRDLTAVSMRRLMSDAVGGETKPVAQRVSETGRLPLALIDWSSEEARFDTGPYITSTLALYSLCQMALAYTPPPPTDYSAQRDYVAGLVARLELDGSETFDEARLLRDIDRAEERGLPFGFGHEAVAAAAEGFRASLGRYIVRPLTELRPYAELISGFESADLLSGSHEQWLGLDRAGRNAYVEEVGVDPSDAAAEVYSVVKPAYRLAFQVVFQKGFIQALSDMDRYRGPVGGLWVNDELITADVFISQWLDRFNRWLAPRLADDDTWAGAGITATGSISWTQASQRAIAGFVVYALVAPLEEWADLDPAAGAVAARDWVESAWKSTGPGKPALSIEGLYKQGSAWKRSVASYVKAQFKARDEDRTPEEEDFIEYAASRLLRLAASAS